MLFSFEWLQRLCPELPGVESAAAALTARGLTVDSVTAAGADHVFDVDVPANRGDCLGHLGLVREMAAAAGAAAPVAAGPGDGGQGPPVQVEIADADLCGRYTASVVRDVRVGPSPEWVVRRLERCGLRSVNNVVDASNLVMLELGQPIHFFDLHRLRPDDRGDCRVRIQRAGRNSALRTLDGEERQLAPDMLVIADGAGPVAIAGVIGGANSEIGPETRDVLIEAAHFNARSIRATARSLGAATDASYRFERGVDPEAPIAAQALAGRLMREIAGGSASSRIVDLYPGAVPLRELDLRPSELARLLGFSLPAKEVLSALAAVGLAPRSGPGDTIAVTVPSWRTDLEREADLVEEVARHVGYDRIPATVSAATEPPVEAADAVIEERARDLLTHSGFQEAIGYAMIGVGEDAEFVSAETRPALALQNPIAEPLAVLRRSLLPGLLRAADRNLRRGNRDVRLFEVGRVFHAAAGGTSPAEPLRLAVVWSGSVQPRHWSRTDRAVDLYDLVGLAEHLLGSLRHGRSWTHARETLAAFHPGRSLSWSDADGPTVAWGGALHPRLQSGFDQELFLLELALDALDARSADVPRQRPLPRVPAVSRDLSLLLPKELPYATLVAALGEVPPPAPERFEAIDRYEGPPLGPDEVSLTVRVLLEPLEQTLTDAETEAYREALVAHLRDSLGVVLRG